MLPRPHFQNNYYLCTRKSIFNNLYNMKRSGFYSVILLLSVVVFASACSSKTEKVNLEKKYQSAKAALQKIQNKLNNPYSVNSVEAVENLLEADSKLSFSYNEDYAEEENLAKYNQLQSDIEATHKNVNAFLQQNANNIKIEKLNERGKLLESSYTLPVYLRQGETLYLNIELEKLGGVNIYNADTHSLIQSWKKRTSIYDSLTVRFDAIYLVEVVPYTTLYASMDIFVKNSSLENILHPVRVKTESETVKKGTFMAKAVEGIKMEKIFDEPRKFTLRGKLKAAFSGSSRGLVAIQVPKGAQDIMYSLRISTNETPANSDGEFSDNMNLSYHKVKFLGLPIYESSRSCGLLNTLLGENVPPREEDAYIDMYVFFNAKEARKFQDGALTSNLKYHLDYSIMGTQSCNGRIPAKGLNTIYLGFDNARMRYNNYVWIEAVSSVAQTEYYRDKYSIVEGDDNDDYDDDDDDDDDEDYDS